MTPIEILEQTVKELQGQLQAAYIRIGVITKELDKYKQKYRDEVDEAFDFKMKQKSLTELNYDGNEFRGRYGEDESV